MTGAIWSWNPFGSHTASKFQKSLAFMVSECIQVYRRSVPFNPLKWRMWETHAIYSTSINGAVFAQNRLSMTCFATEEYEVKSHPPQPKDALATTSIFFFYQEAFLKSSFLKSKPMSIEGRPSAMQRCRWGEARGEPVGMQALGYPTKKNHLSLSLGCPGSLPCSKPQNGRTSWDFICSTASFGN